MKIYRLYFTVILSICFTFLSAQNRTLELKNSDIQIGIDYKNKDYLVFNGFEVFYKKSFQSQEWKIIPYKYNELPKTKDFPYNFFNIKGKNYLVYSGCGEIYEFKNDSIIRIDNSFQHKNQFGSCSFVYNDEIYYFGGYGLFTYKNILTKFDFKTKEWELIKYNNYKNIPQPRDKAISFIKGDNLYLLSGYSENYDTDQVTGVGKQLFDIWKLNLKTKVWKYLGDLKDKSIVSTLADNSNSYQNQNNFYYDSNYIFQLDFKNNKVNYFKQENKFFLSGFEKYNLENNEIIYSQKSTDLSIRDIKIIIEPFDNYSGKIIKTENLVSGFNFNYTLIPLVILLGLIILYLTKKRKQKMVFENCITYKNNTFFHQNKPINNLSIDEINLLSFFFSNYNNPIQMNEVVDFLSKNDDTSYNTLTKKKDTILNSLKQKLAFVLDINEEDLFIYQKNNEDKRIKEIQLNPQYFIN
ncbi:kelch repeat-containing protein [Flavobacterium sp. RSB2_4_14]|uniref:kelch repeat-containing protein n=1 Tax=Flavobacterium sp. RSB2_4_14 TaxID=3447665 RepID=UPI003F2E51CA